MPILYYSYVSTGNSTSNQIQKIVDITGKPTQVEVNSIKSKYARSMLESFVDVRLYRENDNLRRNVHVANAPGNYKKQEAVGTNSSNLVTKLMKKVSVSGSKNATNKSVAEDTFKSDNVKFNSKLNRLFPKALPEEIDLMSRLLRFSPTDRLTAPQCLQHSYVAPFIAKTQYKSKQDVNEESSGDDDSDEDKCDHEIVMPFDDDVKFSTSQYRERLYSEIEARSRDAKKRLKEKQMM